MKTVIGLAFIVVTAFVSVCTSVAAKPSLAVCFTGQANRFSGLENKIASFLRVAAQHYVLDLYLVLADGDAQWVRQQLKSRVFASGASGQQILDALHISNRSGKRFFRDIFADFSPPIQTNVSDVNSVYVSLLENYDRKPREYQERRALSHLRQFDAINRCWKMMKNRQSYDLYARLREDVVFFRSWSPPLVWLQRPGIHVPGCQSWHGLNDKAAFIAGSRSAQIYFEHLWQRFASEDAQFFHEYDIFNPETYLHATMDAASVPAYQHCQTDMPLCTAAPLSMNQYCFRPSDLGLSWVRNDLMYSIPRPIGVGYSCFYEAVHGRALDNDTYFPLTCFSPGQIDRSSICTNFD